MSVAVASNSSQAALRSSEKKSPGSRYNSPPNEAVRTRKDIVQMGEEVETGAGPTKFSSLMKYLDDVESQIEPVATNRSAMALAASPGTGSVLGGGGASPKEAFGEVKAKMISLQLELEEGRNVIKELKNKLE